MVGLANLPQYLAVLAVLVGCPCQGAQSRGPAVGHGDILFLIVACGSTVQGVCPQRIGARAYLLDTEVAIPVGLGPELVVVALQHRLLARLGQDGLILCGAEVAGVAAQRQLPRHRAALLDVGVAHPAVLGEGCHFCGGLRLGVGYHLVVGGGYIAGCRLVDIQQMRPVELGLTAAECHAHTTEVVAVEVAQQDGGAVGGVHRQVLAHHTAVQPLHAGRNRPHTDVAAHHAMQLVVLLEGGVVVFCIDGAIGQTVRCIRHGFSACHLRRCRHLSLQVIVHIGIVEQVGVAAQSHAGLAQRTC